MFCMFSHIYIISSFLRYSGPELSDNYRSGPPSRIDNYRSGGGGDRFSAKEDRAYIPRDNHGGRGKSNYLPPARDMGPPSRYNC